MRRNWAILAVIVAAGLVSWNEYRVWTARKNLHVPPLMPWVPEGGLQPQDSEPVASSLPAGEEECDATIIDLTALQQQTVEPPLADTIEPPPAAPGKFMPAACDRHTLPYVLPNVPQFLPFSADPHDRGTAGAIAETGSKAGACFGGALSKKSAATDPTPEELHVMPRRIDFYPEPTPVELNVMPRPADGKSWWKRSGTWTVDGFHFDVDRNHRTMPDSSNAGEEQQDKPPTTPKNLDVNKRTKLDTMEIRPGDVPLGGLRKPF